MSIQLISVLGKSPAPDGTADWVMMSRLDTAMDVLSRNEGAKLILQGGSSYGIQNATITEAQVGYNYLQKNYKINPDQIILEEASRSTLQQGIIIVERFLTDSSIKKVAVVTDEFHIKRAELVFRGIVANKVELEFVPAPVKIYGKYRELIQQHESVDGLDNLKRLVDCLPPGDVDAYKEYERKYAIVRARALSEGKPRSMIIPVEEVLAAKV